MIKHFNITVSGRVQGVFYRQFCLEQAQKLGLVGFTSNEIDGTVYIEVEGEDEKLRQFVKYCWEGTTGSEISNLKITEGELKKFTGFTIKF